jgi:putative lipoic acid-binding regulatory protein
VTNGEYPAGFYIKIIGAQRPEVRKDREIAVKFILKFYLI